MEAGSLNHFRQANNPFAKFLTFDPKQLLVVGFLQGKVNPRRKEKTYFEHQLTFKSILG